MSFTRYGLQSNPFGGDLVNPLDCPANQSYYVTVEGFGDQKPNIDAWADQSMTKTPFFLIYGCKGTGRTSLCNYIANEFRRNYSTDDPSKDRNILKVNIKIPDEDHLGALHNWMDRLMYMADVNRVEFHPEVKDRFEKEIRNQKPPRSITLYQELLFNAVKQLSDKNRRLVAIFEDVANSKTFTLAQAVFNDPDAPLPDIALVIFTTTEKDIHKDFGRLYPRPRGLPPIELRVLTGKEVLEFIKQRWKQVQPTSAQPFEEQVVVRAFDQVKYPFQLVVQALEYIFNRKIETQQPGGDWPNDQSLKLNRGDIFQFLFEFYHKHPERE